MYDRQKLIEILQVSYHDPRKRIENLLLAMYQIEPEDRPLFLRDCFGFWMMPPKQVDNAKPATANQDYFLCTETQAKLLDEIQKGDIQGCYPFHSQLPALEIASILYKDVEAINKKMGWVAQALYLEEILLKGHHVPYGDFRTEIKTLGMRETEKILAAWPRKYQYLASFLKKFSKGLGRISVWLSVAAPNDKQVSEALTTAAFWYTMHKEFLCPDLSQTEVEVPGHSGSISVVQASDLIASRPESLMEISMVMRQAPWEVDRLSAYIWSLDCSFKVRAAFIGWALNNCYDVQIGRMEAEHMDISYLKEHQRKEHAV